MKNFHSFKCKNCASSHYKQVSDGVFECEYCGAKITNDDTIKDLFISDINSSPKFKKRTRFIKANITEDEFYKKALTHLTMNKFTPNDILTSKFEEVSSRYVFYAIMDVDFTALSVSNIESVVSGNQNTSINISTQETVNFQKGNLICIKLSDDCFSEQTQFVLDNHEELHREINSTSLSQDQIKQRNINYPTKEKVEQKINQTIQNCEAELLSVNNITSNKIVHKINSIVIYAIPEYSLSFTYNDQKYKIASFAYELNIVGNIPTDDSNIQSENKRIFPLSILSSAVAILSILICLYNLSINRSISVIMFDIIFFVCSMLLFVVNISVSKILTKRFNNKLFDEKKTNLEKYLLSKSKQLDQEDLNYINNVMRWN